MTALDVPSARPARVATPSAGDPRLARLSLNQRTTASWDLREAIDGCRAAGLSSIGVWREPVAEAGLETAASWLRAHSVHPDDIRLDLVAVLQPRSGEPEIDHVQGLM